MHLSPVYPKFQWRPIILLEFVFDHIITIFQHVSFVNRKQEKKEIIPSDAFCNTESLQKGEFVQKLMVMISYRITPVLFRIRFSGEKSSPEGRIGKHTRFNANLPKSPSLFCSRIQNPYARFRGIRLAIHEWNKTSSCRFSSDGKGVLRIQVFFCNFMSGAIIFCFMSRWTRLRLVFSCFVAFSPSERIGPYINALAAQYLFPNRP